MVFLNCQLVLMSFNFNEHFWFRCWVSANIILFPSFFSCPFFYLVTNAKIRTCLPHQISECCEGGHVIDQCDEHLPLKNISFSTHHRNTGPLVTQSLYLFAQTGAVSIMHILISQWLGSIFRCIPSNNYSWPEAIASIKFPANVFWK